MIDIDIAANRINLAALCIVWGFLTYVLCCKDDKGGGWTFVAVMFVMAGLMAMVW